jgi:hypothetical protein
MIRRIRWIVPVALMMSLLASDAYAIIGRPLTPMSYAGVARRTTRRAVRATAYAGAATAATAATYAAPMTALPATGCSTIAGPAYSCGGVVYRPYYQGTEVVYVQAP